MNRTLASAVSVLAVLAIPAICFAAVGKTPGSFSVSPTGNATYSVPIWVPPGPAGLHPHMQVVYNSSAGLSTLGIGWSATGLSAITRCNKTFAEDGSPGGVNLTSGDVFCLDGVRLRLTSSNSLSTYGQPGTTYQPETGSFSKVTASTASAGSGPESFTVQARNGATYEYGVTTDSRVLGGGGAAIAWMLDKVTDASGNTMTVLYKSPDSNLAGSTIPDTISWTPSAHNSTTYNYQMKFDYGTNVPQSSSSGYVGGSPVQVSYLLNDIKIKSSSNVVRQYVFGYETSPTTQGYRLNQIKECSDEPASDCLAPTTITYQDGQAGVSGTANTPITTFVGNLTAHHDFDGDGFSDLVYSIGTAWKVRFGSAAGFGAEVSANASGSVAAFGDLLGNGKDGLLVSNGSSWTYYAWNGSSFAAQATSLGAVESNMVGAGLADVDGDGRADLVVLKFTANGTSYSDTVTVRLNTSGAGTASLAAPATWYTKTGTNDGKSTFVPTLTNPDNQPGPLKFFDFNGDGRQDMVFSQAICQGWIPNPGGGESCLAAITTVAELIAQGNSTFTATTGSQMASTAPYTGVFFTNWNNDACTDVVTYDVVNISGCNGTVPATQTTAGGVIGTMDWDGDGRTDLILGGSGVLKVQLSTGSGLANPITTTVPWTATCNVVTLDGDADGLDDVGTFCPTGTPGFTYFTHNQPGVQPDLVASITDGFGVKVQPTYVALTRGVASGVYTKSQDAVAGYKDFIAPTYVVSSYTQSNGSGDPTATYTVDLTYAGGWINTQGLGFTGFSTRRQHDSRDGLYFYQSYSRQFPYIGMLLGSDLRQADNATHITQVTNQLDDLIPSDPIVGGTNNDRHFPYVHISTTDVREYLGPSNNTPITNSVTTVLLDDHGAAKSIDTKITDQDAGSPYHGEIWETDTEMTYPASHTGDWCLDIPQTATVTRKLGTSTVQRTQNITADLATCHVTQIVTSPGDPLYQVTEALAYDSFGNVNSDSLTAANVTGARTSTVDWGTTGQFPVIVKDALANSLGAAGYLTRLGYDYDRGLLTSQIVRSGDETTNNAPALTRLYDSFGRQTKETRPDNTSTSWGFALCSVAGCVNAANKVTVTETDLNTDGSTQTDRLFYLDAYGRTLVSTARLLASGTYSREEVQFDSLGRVAQSSSPCISGTCTTFWTTYTYDALNRVTQVQRPTSASDSSTWLTTIGYAGRTITTTDPLLNASTKVVRVAGLIGQSKDANNYQQNFSYDAAGSLISVTDGQATLFSASYDYGIGAFQRDAFDADLDVSTAVGQHRHYSYDGLGELTSWSDAKGQSFSMDYDPLGRPAHRSEPGLLTTWTWGASAAAHNIGQLQSVSAGSYSESYDFDANGRVSDHIVNIPSDPHGAYRFDYAYDGTTGFLSSLSYPQLASPNYRLTLQYAYQNGILKQVSNGSTVYWAANTTNAAGQITQETLGNGVITNRAFDTLTGWTNSLQSGLGGTAELQNESYAYDKVGNLTQRQNGRVSLTENFHYLDPLYRLTSSDLGGVTNLSVSYAPNGNILSRSDVANNTTWSYDAARLHAVTQAGTGTPQYTYDNNGNVTSGNGKTITWTSFNHPSSISASSGETIQFAYNQNHERWQATYTDPAVGTETTNFVAGNFETTIAVGATHYRHYIYAGGIKVAVIDANSGDGSVTTRYLREDHEGSISGIIDASGASIVKESFTAFGVRRNQCTWSGPPTNGTVTRINSVTRRGYTWQTALGAMGLNDMNGRIQDAVTGRFLSPDPYVPDPANTQSFNRYSYALNNPLSYTDPSGYSQVALAPGGTPENPPPTIPCDLGPLCSGVPGLNPLVPVPGWFGEEGCPLGHPAVCQAYTDLIDYLNKHWKDLYPQTPPPPKPQPPPSSPPPYSTGPSVAPATRGPQSRMWPQGQQAMQQCPRGVCMDQYAVASTVQFDVSTPEGLIRQQMADMAAGAWNAVRSAYLKVANVSLFGLGGADVEGGAATAGAVAEEIGVLRAAAVGKGNFGVGQATRAAAERLGRAWVGEGYTVASDGKTLISANRLRQFRPPSYKPRLGIEQANFEQRLKEGAQWLSNGHLDIIN